MLGASNKPLRYSNQAVCLLKEKGFKVTPIHPKLAVIEGLQVTPNLKSIQEPVETLTLYVGPERIRPLMDDIIKLKPKRVIFNPGTESSELASKLMHAGIHYLEACTLVMLRIGSF
ncbi:MAG: CoA-binding protein [Candidatus Thiodiazotropha sp.]